MTSKSKMRFWVLFAVVVLTCSVITATAIFASDTNNTADPTSTPTLNIVSYNLSYADSVYILYAVGNEGFDRTNYEIKMLFWEEPQEEYALGTEKYSTTNSGKANVKGEKCLVFYSDGLAARKMADYLYSRACVVINGEAYYSEVIKFSVLEYVYGKKEAGGLSNTESKLYETMLDYGAAAQNDFGHNTSNLANATYRKVKLHGGVCPDGFSHGRYQPGRTIVIKANEPAPGMRFSHWKDKNGIIVSYDKEFEILIGKEELEYEAVYKDVSNIATQLALNSTIPYDGDIDDIDLPTAVSFEIGNETVTLEVEWDTTEFVYNTIGEQMLYAELTDKSAYGKYGIEPGSIVMKVTTLPFTYAIDSTTGNYILTGYYGSDTEITIPTSYRNTPITTIASKAFNSNKTLKNVVVPYGITKIESGAFFYCDSIEAITVPFIGESETSSNSWFGWIFGAESYSAQQGLLPIALESITLAEGVTAIRDYAFYNCSQLKEFNIPTTITHIGSYAFSGCTGLTEFTLPENLSYCSLAFNNCKNLKRVNVSNIDILFKISYGAYGTSVGLFNNGTDLYCNGELVTELLIPRGTTNVSNILGGCTSVTKIFIPNTVTTLNSAFSGMKNLKEVVFEEGSKLTFLDGAFYSCTSLKSVDLSGLTELKKLHGTFQYCYSLAEVKLPEGLTEIAYDSFMATAIENITIPNTVQVIGVRAFSVCSKLREIILPNGVVLIDDSAFYGCTKLSKLELPESLTSIGSQAFYGCDSLATVTIPVRVYNIDSQAFGGCDNLAKVIILSERLSTIGSNAFKDCAKLYEVYNLSGLDIKAGAEDNGYIGYYAKVVHTSLDETALVNVDENGFITYSNGDENVLFGYVGTKTEIILPDSINGKGYVIANKTFYSRDNLTSVIISDGVTAIGEHAFYYCDNLTSITIGDSVTSIGSYTFSNCTGLEEIYFNATAMNDLSSNNCVFSNTGKNGNGIKVVIGKNVTKVPAYLFNSNSSSTTPKITSVEFEEGSVCTSIGAYSFYNAVELMSVTIPDSVESIDSYAFWACTGLTSITIPDSVTSVGNYAFHYCTGLTSVTIGNGVTIIGDYAFDYCTELTSVTIGNSVTSIGGSAFRECTVLESINYRGTEEQWNAITKGSYWNFKTGSYTITYNYTGE